MKTSLGKNFIKNLTFIGAVIILFTLVLFTVLHFDNNKSVQKEILILEEQKISRINDLALSYMNQITKTNGYFSSIVLRENEYPLLERDVEWYSRLNDQASLCVALMDYIRLIKISKGNANYQTTSASSYDLSGMLSDDNLVNVGEINGTKVFSYKNIKTDSLLFRLSPNDQDYAENNVYIIVDAGILGQSIFGSDYNEDSLSCIVDKNGNIISTNRSDYIDENIFTLYDFKKSTLKDEEKMLTLKGEKYSLCVKQIGDTELYSIGLTNQNFYSTYYRSIGLKTVTYGIIAFLMAFLLSMVIAYRTYRPIKSLIRSLEDYMPQASIEKGIDEIVYIQDNIAKLYLNNRDLNQAVNEDVVLLKNQQSMALQAQISPHFIYNTLDAINWKASGLLGRKNVISSCVVNMSNVIRYSMDGSTLFATLRDEIAFSKKYVEILKIRYNDKYEVEWDIDETLLDIKVIKICIQPIIENAVFHGLSGLTEKGKITVKAYRDSGNLKIEITDNGIGMSEEKLKNLIEHINDFKNSPPNHIGLRNVNLRLKLLYGEKYGLLISNVENGGVSCSIMIPVEKEGEK